VKTLTEALHQIQADIHFGKSRFDLVCEGGKIVLAAGASRIVETGARGGYVTIIMSRQELADLRALCNELLSKCVEES